MAEQQGDAVRDSKPAEVQMSQSGDMSPHRQRLRAQIDQLTGLARERGEQAFAQGEKDL